MVPERRSPCDDHDGGLFARGSILAFGEDMECEAIHLSRTVADRRCVLTATTSDLRPGSVRRSKGNCIWCCRTVNPRDMTFQCVKPFLRRR